MSSAQDRQANESEERLDKLDREMRQLMVTVRELAESVRESRTRRVDSTEPVEEIRSRLSAEEALESGVASIDTNQQGIAQDELLPGGLGQVTRQSGLTGYS